MSNIVEIHDLAVSFSGLEGDTKAVDGVTFPIPAGKVTALVGESGSGKSVIANTIMRLLPATANIERGQVLFFDKGADEPPIDMAALSPKSSQLRALRGDRIGMIFQEPMTSLSPLHTIGDQIGEVLRLHAREDGKMSRAACLEAAEEMLNRVGFPNPRQSLSQYPFELSGGLRQRAMIAMALINRPALLIADEPTTALDVTIQAQILTLIRDLQGEFGMSVLMITHDLGVVANMADYVVVAYRGRIMERGPVDQVFQNASHPYLQALFRAVPTIGADRDKRLQPLRPIEVSRALAGQQAAEVDSETHKPQPVPRGAPLLEIKGVEKTYPLKAGEGIKALRGIDLTLRKGECLGLVGESGSGKTTLSKIIVGAQHADTGTVRYHAAADKALDVTRFDENQWRRNDLRKKIQFVFQDPFGSLNPRMPVSEILTEPFLVQEVGDQAWRRERAVELMHLVGLDSRKLSAFPHSFSGGQRQRIGVARALALHPELLLCDEPVSALDVSVQAQILNLLKDLQKALDLTYLFVSHNLAVIDYVADRIAVMCRGNLVEVADRDALFNNPTHPYTKALLAAVPEPRLDRKLDFEKIRDGGQSEPEAWPEPFTIDQQHQPGLISVADNHFVRARA
ncbi:MAG: ABC transporter ATP-binding protein [Alphaproteobacteria bacterium]|nr:ABC transporter ATP-binding protein [Alphaproteobacteria bacterium SS10]